MNKLDFNPETLNQTIFHRYGTIMHAEKGLIIRITKRDDLSNWLILSFIGTIFAVSMYYCWNYISGMLLFGLPVLLFFGMFLYLMLYADPKFSLLLSEDRLVLRSQNILGKELRKELLFASLVKLVLVEYRNKAKDTELRFRVKTDIRNHKGGLKLAVLPFLGHIYYSNHFQGKLNREIILFLANKISQLSGAAIELIEEDYPDFSS